MPAPYDQNVAALGPLLWWKYADGSGSSTAADSSGNAYTGTVTGTSTLLTFGNSGVIEGGTCLQISGATSGISAYLQGPTGMPTTDVPFTAIVWLNTTATMPVDGAELVCTRYGGEYTYDLALETGSVIHRDYGNGSSWLATGVNVTAPYSIYDGNWHMLADVVTSTGTTIYLDGVSLGTQAETLTAARLIDSSHQLQSGLYSSDPYYTYYNGYMAELALFPAALTAAQIAQLWTQAHLPILHARRALQAVNRSAVW